MMRQRGFTLLEIVVAIAILAVVSGVLFVLAGSLAQASRQQEAKIAATDDSRAGMEFVVRNLRQAATGSVDWTALPAASVSFSIAEDIDGNGTAVDEGVSIELSPVRTFSRDLNDLNQDGRTTDQLVMEEGGQARVVANGLIADEDTNGNGLLDAGEDTNFNNVLDHGLWFEQAGQGIRVTLQAQRPTDSQGGVALSTLVETVVPRN